MDVAQIKRVTATGDVTTATSYLYSVTLTTTDISSVTVRTGGAAGTVVLVVKAAAGATVSVPLGGAGACPGGIHLTVNTGTTPDVTLVYS